MKSHSSVKTTRMFAPGYSNYHKSNPWHTMSVGKKHKKLFGNVKKIYISEYHSLFKKKIFFNDKKEGLNESKNSMYNHLLGSNFWAFRHPIAVAGAIQMKRSKTYYKNYSKNLSNIFLWFGGMNRSTFLSLCKEAFYWNKLYHNTSFALFFDSLLPNNILKSGFTKNVYTAKKSVAHIQSTVVSNHRLQNWSAQNSHSMFFVKKQFMHKNLYSFMKGISKALYF